MHCPASLSAGSPARMARDQHGVTMLLPAEPGQSVCGLQGTEEGWPLPVPGILQGGGARPAAGVRPLFIQCDPPDWQVRGCYLARIAACVAMLLWLWCSLSLQCPLACCDRGCATLGGRASQVSDPANPGAGIIIAPRAAQHVRRMHRASKPHCATPPPSNSKFRRPAPGTHVNTKPRITAVGCGTCMQGSGQ